MNQSISGQSFLSSSTSTSNAFALSQSVTFENTAQLVSHERNGYDWRQRNEPGADFNFKAGAGGKRLSQQQRLLDVEDAAV